MRMNVIIHFASGSNVHYSTKIRVNIFLKSVQPCCFALRFQKLELVAH